MAIKHQPINCPITFSTTAVFFLSRRIPSSPCIFYRWTEVDFAAWYRIFYSALCIYDCILSNRQRFYLPTCPQRITLSSIVVAPAIPTCPAKRQFRPLLYHGLCAPGYPFGSCTDDCISAYTPVNGAIGSDLHAIFNHYSGRSCSFFIMNVGWSFVIIKYHCQSLFLTVWLHHHQYYNDQE